MATAAVFILLIQKIFANYLMKWGFTMASQEIKVDEDLPNFFKSVKLTQADELILENVNMQENFGINLNDPDTIEVLDLCVMPKKAIQGTPWYQILSNPKYSNDFYYIGAFINEREKLIEDGYGENEQFADQEKAIRCEQSDMIVVLLNLAYIPDKIVKSTKDDEFTFEPGWQFHFKNRMQNFKDDFDKKVEQDESGKFINSLEFELVEDKDTGRKWFAETKEIKELKERYSGLKVYKDKS